MTKIFHKADRNRNRIVEENEMGGILAADPIFTDSSFDYFDTNNDGVITRSEFLDHPNPFFVIYDTDKDCRVTSAEQNIGRK